MKNLSPKLVPAIILTTLLTANLYAGEGQNPAPPPPPGHSATSSGGTSTSKQTIDSRAIQSIDFTNQLWSSLSSLLVGMMK